MPQSTTVTRNKNVTTQKIVLETEENCLDNLEDQLIEKSQKINGNSDDEEIVVVDACPVATRLGRLTAKQYMMSVSVFPEAEDFVFSHEPNSFCQMMRAHMKTDTFVISDKNYESFYKTHNERWSKFCNDIRGEFIGKCKTRYFRAYLFLLFVFHHDTHTLFICRID